MKHERRIPAWLLRDLPALAGMCACFWLFVIPLFTEGFRIIRGGKPDRQKFDALANPLLAAEATLAYALWREAYRRLGYNPKLVKLELADLPTDHAAMLARIRSYMDQVQNLSRAARTTPTSCANAGAPCASPMLRRMPRLARQRRMSWQVLPRLHATALK